MPTATTKKQPTYTPQQPQYNTGPGSYNRESGQKTLIFVAILITIITILIIATLMMINKRNSVMIQGETTQPQEFPYTPDEL